MPYNILLKAHFFKQAGYAVMLGLTSFSFLNYGLTDVVTMALVTEGVGFETDFKMTIALADKLTTT